MDERGFTLVELLTVLAVGVILLAITIPGYAFLLSDSRLTTTTNDLIASIHLARSEAIKRGTRVTVCKTGSPMADSPTCDSTASWEQGWLVFVDGGTRGVIDAGDALLWLKGEASTGVRITTSNYSRYLSYLPGGTSQGSNGLPNGSLRVCVEGRQREIIINSTGRPRLETGTC